MCPKKKHCNNCIRVGNASGGPSELCMLFQNAGEPATWGPNPDQQVILLISYSNYQQVKTTEAFSSVLQFPQAKQKSVLETDHL